MMLAGYADYVARNHIVEVPENYNVLVQATKNAKIAGH